MKKLVIIAHPDILTSKVSKTWISQLEKHPKTFDLHSLYQQYPDLDYDIEKEQQLLTQYEEIIFQFPIHWYSTPFALKKYLDEVFSFGWAFGPNGNKMAGKKIGFAVSTGGNRESYEAGIKLSNLLNDFILSFEYCGCKIGPLHVFYGAMFDPTDRELEENAEEYVRLFKDKVVLSNHA